MEINQLISQLATLTGYINTSNEDEEKSVEKLQASIAEAILNQDPSTIRSKEFIFERSDLFLTSKIDSNRLKKINEVAANVKKVAEPAKTNVFVRNTPVRSTQITGGITRASAGVRVKTVGPLIDKNKLPTWFDFVKVKKLISLYIQGQNKPVLLFDATFKKPKIQLPNSKPVELTKTFTVDPETVWIHGKVLSANVPDELYCGLRVKSGKLPSTPIPLWQIINLPLQTQQKLTLI